MTNKTERYFVVSESELKELVSKAVSNYRISVSTASYTDPDGAERRLNKAEAACRARPVDVDELYKLRAENIKLLDRLEALERVVDTIEWCRAVDEPVSEFILKEIRAIGRGIDYVE